MRVYNILYISHEVLNTINSLTTGYYLLYTPSRNQFSLRSDLDFSDIEALASRSSRVESHGEALYIAGILWMLTPRK